MGTPTVDDLKALIKMNLTNNNVVTIYDVNLATNLIFWMLEVSNANLQELVQRQLSET